VRRLLLSPKWLVGHVLVLTCFVGFLWLGWWQWERAHQSAGSAQNLGYAAQWPLFALFALFGWWKVLRVELARTEVGEQGGEAGGRARRAHSGVERIGPASPLYRPPPAPIDAEPDEEVAAYNRHLAWLNAQDKQGSR
jgi:DNA-binding transcriptional regulator of glucitol operon